MTDQGVDLDAHSPGWRDFFCSPFLILALLYSSSRLQGGGAGLVLALLAAAAAGGGGGGESYGTSCISGSSRALRGLLAAEEWLVELLFTDDCVALLLLDALLVVRRGSSDTFKNGSSAPSTQSSIGDGGGRRLWKFQYIILYSVIDKKILPQRKFSPPEYTY